MGSYKLMKNEEKQNVLFIFSGEFSYELLSFQGILRKYRDSYNKIYVATFPGREMLYQDFATVIPFPHDLASQIHPAENKGKGFPLYQQVLDYCLTYVPKPCLVYSSHTTDWFYPIDEKLDFYGTEGEYINYEADSHINMLIDKQIEKPYITLHPRLLDWHLQRNYDENSWATLAQLLINKGFNIVIVTFNAHLKVPTNLNVTFVYNPSIALQVGLLNKAHTAIYCHSGSMFLSLFTQNRCCILANDQDYEHVHKPNELGIFKRRKGDLCHFIHQPKLNEITPEQVVSELKGVGWIS